MTDAIYTYGTLQDMDFGIRVTQPGVTFNTTSHSMQVALTPVGQTFSAGSATWATATVVQSGAKYRVRVPVGPGQTLNPSRGKYQVHVRGTSATGGYEIPVIEAEGLVIFK